MEAKREFPRRYLTDDFEPSDFSGVRRAYEELAGRPLPDAAALERWCCDWSELLAAVLEEGSRRHIDSTRDTEDAGVKERHLEWIRDMQPELKEREFALWKRLAEHPAAEELPREEFGVFLRAIRNAVELYREENIPLEREEQELEREYDEVMGGMTVSFEGEERPMPQMRKYLEEQDRGRREAAWRAARERLERDADTLTDLYEKMLALRLRCAANAGFDDYRAYRFRQMERFDYTPGDCETFHRSIEEVAVPLVRRLDARRAEKLGLERLRPWDVDVDADGREPLRPFRTEEELVEGARACFAGVSPDFGGWFDMMAEKDLLDLESRKAKAPGGYNAPLPERRLPFIFMNAVGTQLDVRILLHEGGHAFHLMEHRNQRLLANRRSPMEFSEVASMSMELLAFDHLAGAFYDEEGTRRAWIDQLERILRRFPGFALVDAFQHWVYSHPGHGREERTRKWLELRERMDPDTDWSGLERYRSIDWVSIGHIFQVPFYYVEYAIAQLGALQVWRNHLEDGERALAALRRAWSLGESRPLPELFETAGIRFDFSRETLQELLAFTEARYEALLAGG